VDRHIPTYEKLARVRDGALAVVRWRQDVRDVHYTSVSEYRYYDWIVPNMAINAAVLDIRFGCELYYPESYSPQAAATFVIAQTAPPVH
jgi:hypothetical protein